jgi:hypothetical protein
MPAWGLGTQINGTHADLQIDTGGLGIYIAHEFADRAGLKPIGRISVMGLGNQRDQNGYLTFAKSIRIGNLEFRNCPVEVSDRRDIGGRDGTISMDLFKQYLVTLDFPLQQMRLSPLPTPMAMASAAQDGVEGLDSVPGIYDRDPVPITRGFYPVYRLGPFLMLPTKLNGSKPQLMILDTGASATVMNTATARKLGHVHEDNQRSLQGVSGFSSQLYYTKVHLETANLDHIDYDVSVVDTTKLSDSIGTEVAGVIGFGLLRQAVLDIDYRDGLVRIAIDKEHGYNKDGGRGPFAPCILCERVIYSRYNPNLE